MRTFRPVAVALGMALVLPILASGQEGRVRIAFAIEEQPLGKALTEFARQAHLQILMRDEDVASKQKRVPAVSGEMSAREAIERILLSTGLRYEFVNEKTVRITRATERTSSATTLLSLRIAQVADVSRDYSQGISATEESGGQPAKSAEVTPQGLEQVLVTGTHVRGEESAGSHLLVIGRDEINRSGYATVQDLLNALPQNFGGGVSQDNAADVTALNLNGGTSLNLRGLGAASTLVLIDGRRQAEGGLNGTFVDVSSIAASAIERIEILPDGASAIYGSDAVGGVVNFILRKDFQGAETGIRLGTLGGDADEQQFSQLLGTRWNSGNVLFGYQYYKRDALDRADRIYSANGDYTRFGGSDFRNFKSNPGNILGPDGRPAFAIPTGQDGSALTTADLLAGVVNYAPERGDLLAEQRTHSAFFTVSQNVAEDVELFVEGRYARRDTNSTGDGFTTSIPVPASYPFFVDPFGGSFLVSVGYNFLDDLGPVQSRSSTDTYATTVGVGLDLSSSWRLNLSGSYAKESAKFDNSNILNFGALLGQLFNPAQDPATAFNPFGDGSNTDPATLEALRASQSNSGTSDVWGANVAADGTLFEMPGGEVRLAVGADYRKEHIRSDQFLSFIDTPIGRSDSSRNVSALFAELAVPLIGAGNAGRGGQRLSLSLAGRYEDYSDFGTTFDPRFGVTWAPGSMLTLRGTWGTSFRAPRLIEQDESLTANSSTGNSPFISFIEDPQSPTGFSNVLFRVGGNRNLKPEEATTWTLGMDLAFEARPSIDLSLTYFNIDYTDRILAGGPAGNRDAILLQESVWRELITRNPNAAQLAPFCNEPAFALDCTIPPDAIADVRLRNLASLRTSGLDFNLRDAVDTAAGTFSAGLNATYLVDFSQSVSRDAAELDALDTVGNPLALRLRAQLSWNRGAWSTTAFVNHAGAYRDSLSEPSRSISSWTTLDLSLGYRTNDGDRMLDSLQLMFTAVNVFDKEPPFVNLALGDHGVGYDTANADLLGRILSVQVRKAW